MTRTPLKVNLLGFGTVGQALAELLLERERAGRDDVRVVAITDRGGSLADPAGVNIADALASKGRTGSVATTGPSPSLADLARSVDADVVVDVLPTDLQTARPSRAVVHAALGAGRHLVTAGKGILALHGREAHDLARARGLRILGSATVLGSTPALELIANAFRGDRVTRFQGVLNGSTNMLLSRIEEGATWADALREAREAGVLEADPALDVQGLDAAAKAVILANHVWGRAWSLKDVRVQGIEAVDPAEARRARGQGLAVRLVATASPQDGVEVAPMTLPLEHPLVVRGAENVLRLELAAAGAITLRGPGAGGRETASAVLSDLLTLVEDLDKNRTAHDSEHGHANERKAPDAQPTPGHARTGHA